MKLSILIPAIAGITFILIRGWRLKRVPSLYDFGTLFTTGGTLYGGFALLYYGFSEKAILTDTVGDYQLFIIFGGLALFWLSHTILKKLLGKKRKKSS